MANRKFNNLKHRKKLRNDNPSYLILTEDLKSSPNYIAGLIRHLNHNPRKFEIKHVGSSPKSIQECAKKNIRKYDFIYCVFDKDSHDSKGNTYTNLLNWINNHNHVKCINSVPCFEYWLYLHFDNHNASLFTSKATEDLLKTKISNYNKGKISFEEFKDKLAKAEINARASVDRCLRDGTDDPLTRMGEFIEHLRGLPKKIKGF